MYSLHGKIGRRGFWLNRGGTSVFETSHKFGILPSSYANISNSDFRIKPTNLLGDKWRVIKNGDPIGYLDFSHYQYSLITLNRLDGSVDKFRLDEDGYSYIYVLTGRDGTVMRFKGSLNPLRFDLKYDVEIISDDFADSVLIELMFYAGEILFRKIRPDASPL